MREAANLDSFTSETTTVKIELYECELWRHIKQMLNCVMCIGSTKLYQVPSTNVFRFPTTVYSKFTREYLCFFSLMMIILLLFRDDFHSICISDWRKFCEAERVFFFFEWCFLDWVILFSDSFLLNELRLSFVIPCAKYDCVSHAITTLNSEKEKKGQNGHTFKKCKPNLPTPIYLSS